MSIERSTLGDCPFCGTPVPRQNVLIRYEDGVFAECPSCGDPVSPD